MPRADVVLLRLRCKAWQQVTRCIGCIATISHALVPRTRSTWREGAQERVEGSGRANGWVADLPAGGTGFTPNCLTG